MYLLFARTKTILFRLILIVFIVSNFDNIGFAQELKNQLPAHPGLDSEERLQVYLKQIEKYQTKGDTLLEKYLNAAYEDFSINNFNRGSALILNKIGQFYLAKGSFSSSFDAYKRAKELFIKISDEENLAYAIAGMGTADGRRGNLQSSNTLLLEALSLFEKQNNISGIGLSYIRLGTVSAMLKNYERSFEYFERALPYSLEKDTFNLITIYNNMGGVSDELHGVESSFIYYEKALKLATSEKLEPSKVLALTNLGTALVLNGQKERGLAYLQEGLELAEKHGLLEEKLMILINKASFDNKYPDKNLEKELISIFKKSSEAEIYTISDLALNQLILYYKQANDHKQVIRYLEEQRSIRDLKFYQNQAAEIARIQSNFDLERSYENINNLKGQIISHKRENRYILAIAGILLLAACLLLWFSLTKNKINRVLVEKENELTTANQVKDRLFSIIGHDLKGGLSNQSMGLELLKSEFPNDHLVLQSLGANLETMTETLDNLLNWGKIQIKGGFHNPIIFDLYPLLEMLIERSAYFAHSKQISIINQVPVGTYFNADPDQVQFIIRNLISNAIKFSNPSSQIWIGIHHSNESISQTIFVKDEGIGLMNGQEKLIFDSFNVSQKGTLGETGNSLALMISKEFATQNQGNIWAQKNKYQGSTFFLQLRRGYLEGK